MKQPPVFYETRLVSIGILLGRQIKAARKGAGVKQSELSKRLGNSHAAVSDIERGRTRIDLALLSMIAAELGVSVHSLADPVLDAIDARQDGVV